MRAETQRERRDRISTEQSNPVILDDLHHSAAYKPDALAKDDGFILR